MYFYGLALARDYEAPQSARANAVAQLLARRFGNHDVCAQLFIERFQSRRQTCCIADSGVVESKNRAEIAGEDLAAIDANACAQFVPGDLRAPGLDHGPRGANGMFGVPLIWQRRTPNCHHCVAHVLDDRPIVLADAAGGLV